MWINSKQHLFFESCQMVSFTARDCKIVAVQVQKDIRQHGKAHKSISANQRAQNVGTLPKSRHSTFHFITIQIRAVLAEQYQNYSSRIFYKIMRQS